MTNDWPCVTYMMNGMAVGALDGALLDPDKAMPRDVVGLPTDETEGTKVGLAGVDAVLDGVAGMTMITATPA